MKCTRNTIVPLVVSKTFGSGRAGTKAMALDVLMIYVELDMAEYVIVCCYTINTRMKLLRDWIIKRLKMSCLRYMH